MSNVPQTVEDAIAQAKLATQAALDDGYRRLQVELIVPEIALQAQAIALEFSSLFGANLTIIFPDTGAAALARRDWGETPFKISDLGSSRTSIERKISPEDQAFLLACPSSVEVEQVEKLCNLAGDRPVVLLIPQLENVSIVGIGYAARQLRERFISTLESCYYFKPLDGAVVLRSYPSPWQVWVENDGYELVAEEPQKPMGDQLDQILAKANNQEQPLNRGFLASLQQFLRALSQ